MRRSNSLIPEDLKDLTVWPGVDPDALEKDARALYRKREQAVRHYVQGAPVSEVEQITGVARTQLYRLVERCVSRHSDGRIYGWRALLPHLRTKTYTRIDKVGPGAPGKFGGASGAMTQLLERYPLLEQFLQREIALHHLTISPSGRLLHLRAAHRQFIARCRELGLTNRHYPLNQEQKGLRALGYAIRRMMSTSFADSAKASGAELIHPNRPPADWPEPVPITRAFEAVEFDGHKLDVRLRLRVKDPLGFEHDMEIGRAWLLVVLDVFSRAVLGWRFAVVPEYNRYDVIQAIIHALTPKRKRKQFLIPALRYHAGAGFVDEAVPAATYAVWDWLRFDNARANVSESKCVTGARP